ncbi:MAG: metal-sensing transcriptional repressor [Oscillospiraceae bacterium]|nr:metal-sensing transcriptional repressor [Oscillospiraceae bacterium]
MDNEKKSAQYDTRYMASRISRAIGHIRLVRSMVEDGADCTEVLIQLASARGQLDSICSNLMAQYAESFAEEYRKTGDTALLDAFKAELNRAIRK